MAKVSILMNGYNCEEYLSIAIDSIYAQTFDDWEIIFIDNCSTDKTKQILDTYDNKLKYYKTSENISLCSARVFAKQFIKGDFFCVLDTDDMWMPDKLEKQVDVMENNENIGIVYSNSIFFTNDGDEKLAYDIIMPNGNLFEQMLSNYFLSLETVMIRRSVMEKHNIYFDPKYNVSSDAEFFIKLSYFTECQYINKPLANWRYGHGSESDRSLCLFPREYEILLTDLSKMIKNFEITYKNEIYSLMTKVYNMYGICYWNKTEMQMSRKYFFKALTRNIKYTIPYIMSFFIRYKLYVKLRRKFKKI